MCVAVRAARRVFLLYRVFAVTVRVPLPATAESERSGGTCTDLLGCWLAAQARALVVVRNRKPKRVRRV